LPFGHLVPACSTFFYAVRGYSVLNLFPILFLICDDPVSEERSEFDGGKNQGLDPKGQTPILKDQQS
jgi:hypothetical protein